MLRAEELLAGSELVYELEVPDAVLRPGGVGVKPEDALVSLRPLRVGDLQRLTRAAREQDQLLACLMVQQALVAPKLTVPQVMSLHVGLLTWLLDQVNRISGTNLDEAALSQHAEAPLVRAAFLLARAYGWTPAEVNDLTLGQILLHLKMLEEVS